MNFLMSYAGLLTRMAVRDVPNLTVWSNLKTKTI